MLMFSGECGSGGLGGTISSEPATTELCESLSFFTSEPAFGRTSSAPLSLNLVREEDI
jgi:hypothetical protein